MVAKASLIFDSPRTQQVGVTVKAPHRCKV